jgi:hypothetical protein
VSGNSTANSSEDILNSGSRWNRWEPHIHTPETLFNNQFKGDDAWEKYIAALEASNPPIRALAVTDYYLTDKYETVLAAKAAGRLKQIDLIFPNVELRLDVGTSKGKSVNIHLLVSPEDPNHLAELRRFLSFLQFPALGDTFACTPDDLKRLGKRHDASIVDDRVATRHGAGQFKVNLAQFREAYKNNEWAKKNILIAVAGAETDGTSGVREGQDKLLREEIEAFAHVIFASSVAQREFWLGRKSVSVEQLRERYGGLKPCLHGSDAHELDKVGQPDDERYSWIKGALDFDSLRQACIDPAGRAFVGKRPPFRATPSQVISSVELTNAPWAMTPKLALNPGLVAIIGARGSGKTALADAIAAGCDATSGRVSDASFIVRAREHLSGAGVKLEWETGDPTERPLIDAAYDPSLYPRARYLSQKFVEELCSANTMTDELLREIERVIFNAHSTSERDGTDDFDELLDLRTAVLHDNRERDEETIANLSDRIGREHEKQVQVSPLKSQIDQKRTLIANYIKSRDALVSSGNAERVARLSALSEAAEYVRKQIRLWSYEEQTLHSLRNDVSDFRRNRVPEALRSAKEEFRASNLTDEEWERFRQKYEGDVDGTLTMRLAKAHKEAEAWRGKPQAAKSNDKDPYIADDANLKQCSLADLDAEIGRVQRLINVDNDTANRFRTVSLKIAEENTALEKLVETLADCEKAEERIKELQQEREETYLRVFEAIVGEEKVLHALYRPLMDRLAGGTGTMKRLSFSVSRHADIAAWAREGEALFDLRTGPFKGRGTLEEWANAELKEAWEKGDPATVSAAMAAFRKNHQPNLLDLSIVPRAQQADYRNWLLT